jgi:hypothetical protein
MKIPMGGAAMCAKTHMYRKFALNRVQPGSRPAGNHSKRSPDEEGWYQSDPSIFFISSWIDFLIGSTGSENTGGDELGDA